MRPAILPTSSWNWLQIWPIDTLSARCAPHTSKTWYWPMSQWSAIRLWQQLQTAGLATANIGYLTDMICCPGGDYCSLANAKSIPVAEAIQAASSDLDYLYDLGPLELNISGCMNACGHHHIGHIGILGVDKKGQEFYQVCLGGSQAKDASIGKILGPSFKQEDMPDVIEKILCTYLELRDGRRDFPGHLSSCGDRTLQGAGLCQGSLRTEPSSRTSGSR